ncbi:MAG TPA: prepilin-type N-terminal cleavage/methylation domain-containing protein [Verrucomicrobiae bacterium]|jgi:prepilin-type N-terminal cleavage/methylation domain-containing protein
MRLPNPVSAKRNTRGFTLAELLVATALATMVAGIVMGTFIYSATSFSAMGNYSDLDRNSRNAVDVLSREIRNSSALLSFTNSPKSLTFTNVTTGKTVTIAYDAVNRVLTLAKTGQATVTLLTQCDKWDFSLYSKAPIITTNITFSGATNGSGATDITACKLINMNWRCSRTIFGSKRNTESIQTAEIVLRNKVN